MNDTKSKRRVFRVKEINHRFYIKQQNENVFGGFRQNEFHRVGKILMEIYSQQF